MGKLTGFSLAVAILISCSAWAGSDIGFSGMEVIKLDRGTRDLIISDLDGDGITDLSLINNDKAGIQLLRQYASDEQRDKEKTATHAGRWEPVLDDSRFGKRRVATGLRMYALASADLDGNGMVDFAVTAKSEGLVLFYQNRPGHWERGWSYERETPTQWHGALLAEDLDGDGRTDLAMLAEQSLLVFRQREDGHFHPVRRYPLADPDNYGLMSADINRDGHRDLLYITRKSRYALRVRLQDRQGGFAVERMLRLDTPRNVPVLLEQADKVEIALIDAATGLLEVSGFQFGTGEAGDGPVPQVHALPSKVSGASAYAVGDLDGDGEEEVIAADPSASQVWIYRNLGDAVFSEPRAYPVFSGVTSISLGDADRDGRMELYLASSKERVVGVSQLEKDGRLSYPQPIVLDQKPLAVTFIPAVAEQPASVVGVFKSGKKRFLKLFEPQEDGWAESGKIALEGLATDPKGLRAVDWNQDGHLDLALFIPRSPAVLFLGDAAGGFQRFSAKQGFRAALFDGVKAGDLTLADPDADGKQEILVNGKGFVRSLSIGMDAGIKVEDQFNLNDPAARATSALLYDLDADKIPELLITTRGGDRLEVQHKVDAGLYRPWRSFAIGGIELVGTRRQKLSNGDEALLYLGRDRFWVIKTTTGNLALKRLVSHETDLEKVKYGELALGDFNADGAYELAALDDRKTRILEILHRDKERLTRQLHFAVFDDPADTDKHSGSPEPRELLVADINSDNKDDVILLVHDRVLIYIAK